VVDSGASLISLPSDDAQPLFARGLIRPGDLRGVRMTKLANGTMVPAKIYSLHSVKVGDREVKDVLAAVYAGHGPRLLGQSFLKRFKSWSVDNDRRLLVLSD
jgi:clan AA aspartic protease (TIGR02281 family)